MNKRAKITILILALLNIGVGYFAFTLGTTYAQMQFTHFTWHTDTTNLDPTAREYHFLKYLHDNRQHLREMGLSIVASNIDDPDRFVKKSEPEDKAPSN